MQLHGIHHLTAVTANATGNLHFYTGTLGMRLVKKTVNQDDVSSYHLFYADGMATPGSDLTFFDWAAPRERRGANSIVRTALRVSGESALEWWAKHLDSQQILHSGIHSRDGRITLDFDDPEGQRLSLIDDGRAGEAHPWERSPIPAGYQIRGLGPITISVSRWARTDAILQGLMQMRPIREYSSAIDSRTVVYTMGGGGPAAELHVVDEPDLAPGRAGAGGVHHVAFRTTLADYQTWADRLVEYGMATSGPVDRFYFRSLYFREPNGILFELATDEPGFTADETLETLGEKLSLPPFLEARRSEIQAGLKPL
jgi:glyoxalase family protein